MSNAPTTNPPDDFPTAGRLAAVDYGTVRIGVAVCDPDRRLASPWEVRQRQSTEADAAFFCQLVQQERILGWVVGLPIHGDGRESESSARARMFARWLRMVTLRPVRLFDERFTTTTAQARLRRTGISRGRTKQRLDAIAAQVLLEAFLESALARPDEIPGRPADGPITFEQSLD